ncbi:MAG: hypothetical protein AAF938_07690 [Myxococcota bacterium]
MAQPNAALAGNDEGVLIGDLASVIGGAVTAVTSNGAALWYNPAGVVQGAENTLDVSVTAYTLRLGSTPALLSSADGATANGDTRDFTIIPAAVTYVRRIGSNTRFAFGIFQPNSVDSTVSASLLTEGDQPSRWEGTVRENLSETHVLLGVGIRLHETLNLGVALNAYFVSLDRTGRFDGSRVGDPSTFFSYAGTRARSAFGATAAVGIQWRPHPRLALGLSFRAPGTVFLASTQIDEFTTTSADGNLDSERVELDRTDHLDLLYPARVRFGVAYTSTNWIVSADFDAQHQLTNESLNVERSALYNVRAGVQRRLGDHFTIGGGFFTDRSPWRPRGEFLDRRIDYYGGSFGISFDSDRLLDENVEDVGRLTFGTTIALRYAYGTGQIVGGQVSETFAPENTVVTLVDHTEHELGINVAARFQF